jgi:hypothetical protein
MGVAAAAAGKNQDVSGKMPDAYIREQNGNNKHPVSQITPPWQLYAPKST